MQSRNTSKQTRKVAEETVTTAQENGVANSEVKAKSRTPKSSATKKETNETGRAKHRSASVTETGLEIPSVKPAAPFASRAIDSAVIDPVGVMTPSPETHEVTHAHIANLAYSYWIARDYAHGSAEEDWHRAERELREKR